MRWHFFRDFVLLIGGLAGTMHETLSEHAERPQLLLLFAGMMGLPAFLSHRNRNGDGSKP